MKLDSLIAIAFAATALSGAWGADWHVDANNGNDAWDGTSAAIPSQEAVEAAIAAGEAVPGPRKTLHAMMSDERVVAGDTVHAAEGDYCEGGAVNGTGKTVNRVQVKAGVTLKASGSRDATFISGSDGTYAAGAYSNGAVRCVYFVAPPDKADYGRGIVKGFTLQKGRTANDSEHGGASTGGGLLVECVLKNNGCSHSSRGGTMNGGTALRCRFVSAARGFLGFSSTVVVDSIVEASGAFYSGCKIYNSTFAGDGYVKDSKSYNCFFIGEGTTESNQKNNNGTPSYHYNAYSREKFHATSCSTNGACRTVTAGQTPYDETTLRPSVSSVAIDAGTISYYETATNGWKAAWLVECGKDYYGGERVVNGKIDVGCGEMQMRDTVVTITDECGGLVVDGAEKGESSIGRGVTKDVVFSRTFTSDRLCLGVNVDGVFYSFGGTTSDIPQTVSLSWSLRHDYTIAAVYEENQKDWYVNPGPLGDDGNRGYHRLCPRKTLAKAMELASEDSGNIVHAAAGVYDSFPEGYSGNSRVVVKKGVGLVADDWPAKETAIVGEKDTTSSNKDSYGNGDNAVRCVEVNDGGYVRGFKLTGGRTNFGDGESACGGGALLKGSSALIDCEVTGNGCKYRGRGVRCVSSSGAIIRTYVHDQSCGSYEVYYGTVVDSCVKCPASNNPYYGTSTILNSTMLGGSVRTNTKNMKIINSYLVSASSPSAAASSVSTNCVFVNTSAKAMGDWCTCDPATCRFEASVDDNLDENSKPKSRSSALIDSGDRALYDKYYPSAWAQFKDLDIACGQRVYNGEIDVGAAEYDWRGDYASKVNSKVEVASADPDTVLVEQGIDIKAGDTLRLRVKLHAGGTVSLNISGGATVMVDGAEIEGVAGVYAFGGEKGAVCEIAVSAGEAGAVLSSVALPKHGTVVVVR